MAIPYQEASRQSRFHDDDEDQDSDLDYDSDQDPSYNVLSDSCTKFLKLSIDKKEKSRRSKDLDEDSEPDPDEILIPPELSKKDKQSFENVQRIIEDGQIEKLKVDQCKVYLRKNGLRLTGNKDTLIQRIKTHIQILNGGGEKLYPAFSFVLNCKGDACTGDVIMFEQNVYEMFNIASRSGNGPPCGTRIVAGRIVKESYGASKQQHTFTIEVFWSKGEKPLPPLHPLLVKGRNLYRLKTLRQRWEDEGERQKILMEKHSRGCLARSDRETRIKEKEMRKIMKPNRLSRKELSGKQPHLKSISIAKQPVQSVNPGKPANHPHPSGLSIDSGKLLVKFQQPGFDVYSGVPTTEHGRLGLSIGSGNPANQHKEQKTQTQSGFDVYPGVPTTEHGRSGLSVGSGNPANQHNEQKTQTQSNDYNKTCQNAFAYANTNHVRQPLTNRNHFPPNSLPQRQGQLTNEQKTQTQSSDYNKTYQNAFTYANTNHVPPTSLPQRQGHTQGQLCRHFAQGRCYYGDNCKFLHELRNENVQRIEDRWNMRGQS